MKYFNSLPKVVYTDKNNTRTLYTNLMSRASVIPSVLNNALSFYKDKTLLRIEKFLDKHNLKIIK